jgi:hypothetical protein
MDATQRTSSGTQLDSSIINLRVTAGKKKMTIVRRLKKTTAAIMRGIGAVPAKSTRMSSNPSNVAAQQADSSPSIPSAEEVTKSLRRKSILLLEVVGVLDLVNEKDVSQALINKLVRILFLNNQVVDTDDSGCLGFPHLLRLLSSTDSIQEPSEIPKRILLAMSESFDFPLLFLELFKLLFLSQLPLELYSLKLF